MKLYTYNCKELKFESFLSNKKLIIIITSLIFIFWAGVFLGMFIHYNQKNKLIFENHLNIEEEYPFSEERLINEIQRLDFRFPYIALAQAKLETGNFTSKIFLENNNLWGMREAKSRINLAQGTQYNYAYYDSWEESLFDYSLYYATYLHKFKTEEQLFEFLDNVYAEDSLYVPKLKNFINKYNLKSKFN